MKVNPINRKHLLLCLLLCCAIGLLHPVTSSATPARDKYNYAEACYKKLRSSAKKQKYRHNWLSCIENFQKVYRHDPAGPWAAAGLYMAGTLYKELYKRSFKTSDKREAIDIFERIVNRFPKSQYRHRAKAAIRAFSQTETKGRPYKIVREKKQKKKSTKPLPAKSQTSGHIKPTAGKKTTVQGLRFWSNPSYTRVVIDMDGEASYTHRLLKKDPAIHKPKRLYIELNNSSLGKGIKKIIPIHDNLLSDARAGQYTPNSVRVVVDIKSFKTYKIFSLKNPFRIVIDVWGDTRRPKHVRKQTPKTAKKGGKLPTSALAKQLSLGVKRIVIDPGHGGKDFGAAGYLKGIFEKNVVLQVAKKLVKKIPAKLKCEAIMTRRGDRYLTLEERTAIANTKNADLFISIHTNASRDQRAYGIETYFLNLATDDESILVAARENATSTKNISDLQTILNDLMQNAKINESSRLAVHVQESLCNHLKKKKYRRIKNKGVKQAPFYVLLGAQMPAILIEISFISNSRECKRLTSPTYQDSLSDAIIKGIQKYIEETHPTAFLKTPPYAGTAG